MSLDRSADGEIFAWSRSIVEKWNPESEHRKRADQFMQRILQRLQGVEFATDIKTTARQIHENLLAAFGIDPASQPWAGMIDLALKDADWGRTLKGCAHTLVSIVPGNPMLDRLGLQLAGQKTLHCTLHKYLVTGRDLDSIEEVFRRDHCDSCKDKTPRPPDWSFSDKWQNREYDRWAQYLVESGSRRAQHS